MINTQKRQHNGNKISTRVERVGGVGDGDGDKCKSINMQITCEKTFKLNLKKFCR